MDHDDMVKAPEAFTAHSAWRKARPIYTGVLRYFPDALMAVAHCSQVGNDQHNPGQPVHWDKSLSSDEADALVRHLLKAGTLDTDGVRHSAKVAWRALALLQRELDSDLWVVAHAPDRALVAAAPDLLAALKAIAESPGFEPDEPYGVAALAVIAKAEGRTLDTLRAALTKEG